MGSENGSGFGVIASTDLVGDHTLDFPDFHGRRVGGEATGASINGEVVVVGNAGAGDGASSQDDKGKAARTRIKRLMKEFVMGEAQSTHGDTLTLSECLQVKINALFNQN